MTIERSKGRTAAATTLSGLMIAGLAVGGATAANADVEGTTENPVSASEIDFTIHNLSLERSPQTAIAGEETEIVVVAYNEDGTQGAVLDPADYTVLTDNGEVDGNIVVFNDQEDDIVEREIEILLNAEGETRGVEGTIRVARDAEVAVGLGVSIEFNEETTHGYAPPMVPGDDFNVNADGPFYSGEEVTAELDGQTVGSATADENGNVSGLNVNIPDDIEAGEYTLILTGSESGLESTVSIEVFDPELWIDAEEIHPGEDFAVRGSGFHANETINFRMQGEFPDQDEFEDIQVQADESGSFELVYNIPTQSEPGQYMARAVGETSDRQSTIGFIVSDAGIEIIDPEDVEVDEEVSPEAPAHNEEDNTVEIPEVEGVSYTVDGEAVEGTVEVPEDGLTVGAEAEEGYVFAEDATTEWSYDYVEAEDEVLEEVTPTAPTRDGNVITIPEIEGVVYYAGGSGSVLGGEIDLDELGVGGIVIHAEPDNGYEFSDETEVVDWVFEAYSPEVEGEDEDVVEVSPEAPEHSAEENTVTIPEVEGVVYTVNGEAAEGVVEVPEDGLTVAAELVEGFEFAEDATTEWSYDYVSGDEEDEYVVDPELSVSHDEIPYDEFEDVVVSGTGFTQEGEVEAVLTSEEGDDRDLGTQTASADGEITIPLVPEAGEGEPVRPDVYTVTAVDAETGEEASVSFTVVGDEEVEGGITPQPEDPTSDDEEEEVAPEDDAGTTPDGGQTFDRPETDRPDRDDPVEPVDEGTAPGGGDVETREDEDATGDPVEILSGYANENPGAFWGLLALGGAGLAGIGFGAYRIMSRKTA